METIYLTKEQVDEELVSDIVAFSVAESGAMGESGRILLLTEEEILYETNYIYDEEIVNEIFKISCTLKKCINGFLNKGDVLPNGWKHTYLGAGNHLFMLGFIDKKFHQIVDRNELESGSYITWIETVVGIIQKLRIKRDYDKVLCKCRTNFNIVPHNAMQKELSGNTKIRESLCVEWESEYNRPEKIVAIGINPSTACDGESDVTMTKLCRFLDMYGFNNVSMLNLYESVSPEQIKINKATKTDFNKKRDILDKADIILIVWGIDGHSRCKGEVAKVLNDYSEKLYCIKNQNDRYPAHPSRMSYESELIPIKSAKQYLCCGLLENTSEK